MAKKITNLTFVVKTDGSGEVVEVRYVGKSDDGTHLFGAATSELTAGDKQSLKNVVAKVISSLEK